MDKHKWNDSAHGANPAPATSDESADVQAGSSSKLLVSSLSSVIHRDSRKRTQPGVDVEKDPNDAKPEDQGMQKGQGPATLATPDSALPTSKEGATPPSTVAYALDILVSPEQGQALCVDIVAVHDYDETSVKWTYKDRKAVLERELERIKAKKKVATNPKAPGIDGEGVRGTAKPPTADPSKTNEATYIDATPVAAEIMMHGPHQASQKQIEKGAAVQTQDFGTNPGIRTATHPVTESHETASNRTTETSGVSQASAVSGVSWLQDPDMLPKALPGARVLTFTYPVEDLKKLSANSDHKGPPDFIEKAAQELLVRINEKRQDPDYQNVPIVFIGAGLGGLVVQKAVCLSPRRKETGNPPAVAAPILGDSTASANPQAATPKMLVMQQDQIADIVLLDTPFPKKEGEHLNGFFPHSAAGVRMSAVMSIIRKTESEWSAPGIDRLWSDFWVYLCGREKTTRISWLHSAITGTISRTVVPKKGSIPWAEKCPVITLYRIPLNRHRRLTNFRDARDTGYKVTINRLLDSLMIKAVSDKKYKELQLSLMKAGSRIDITIGWKLSNTRDEWKLPLLHLAVMAANDDAVNTLLGNGVDSQAQDQKGQTALHRSIRLFYDLDNLPSGLLRDAKQNCLSNIISQLLLFTKKAELNNKRDHQGLTARDIVQRISSCDCPDHPCKHDVIQSLVDNHQPRAIRRSDEPGEKPWGGWRAPYRGALQYEACEQAKAIIGEFYNTVEGPKADYEMPSILGLIYQKELGPFRILSKIVDRIEVSHDNMGKLVPCCRWIHLPANNEQWVQDLFIRLGRRDTSMHGQRHTGYTVFNRHMTPQAKKYKHDEKMKFAPPEPKAAGQGQAVPLSSIPEHARIVETDDLESDGLDFSEILQADRGKHWSNLAIPRGLESRGETIALFMPILAYEEHRPRKKMTKAIGRTRHLRSTFTPKRASTIYSTSLSDEMDKRKKYDTSSVDAYLKVKNLQPLHCRRTLDQYCYYMLDNTEARDRDQVVYKWARKQEDRRKAPEGGRGPNTFGPEDDVFTETQEALFDDDGDDHRKAEMEFRPKNRPVIMVDQLWLWVLPDGTVISSLPNCANPAETYNLKYKLEMSLFDDLNNPIRSADDLTTAILKNCVDFFRREGPCFVKFQDCFQYSISNIAEEEARTYADYENAVKELERKEQGEETSMSTRDYTDTFSRITTETNRLVEIMDIQDELNIVDSVLLTQETVLESLVEHIKDVVTSNSSKTSGDGSKTKTALDYPTHIQEAIQIVKQNRRSVADMVTSAKRVQDDLKQLLDFKQQQSSAWEMRYSRKLAQQGRRQNNIMLMFTVVTIIFLPMSFISSFFAINIDAFPKDPGSGDTSWPLGTISAYLFGISLALSFPLILGACYINRVARMASKRPKKRAGPGGGSTATNTTKEHDSDSSDSDLDSKPHLSRHHHHHHHHHRIRSLSRRESIDSHTIGDTFTEEDENSDYAPLFHHFRFHHRIPLLRRLWKYGTYRVWELEGLDAGLEEFEWDYPLNQFRKMATWPVEEALRRVGLAKLSNRYSDHERAWRSNQEDDETMRQLVREKMEMRGPWEWEGGLLGRRRTGDDGVVVGDGDRLFRRKRRVGDEERMY